MVINNSRDYDINRGTELMLRRRKVKNQPEKNVEKFNFLKVFSFLAREFSFKIELTVNKKQ